MRLGTTSYIYPAGILRNVELLANIVDDIELVLFDVEGYGSNIPDMELVEGLNRFAADHNLTYTVHMTMDLRMANDGGRLDVSLEKAREVISRTRTLNLSGYIAHLNGEGMMNEPSSMEIQKWQDQAHRAIELVCGWLDHPGQFCLENIERWDPELFSPIVEDLPICRCIDIGHLFVQDVDPLEHLNSWINRTRVVHLHGIAEKDHNSLSHVPLDKLDPVISFLEGRFKGILTLEVFSEADFFNSVDTILASLGRLRQNSKDLLSTIVC